MERKILQFIEYDIALLVRLITAYSPRLGSLDRSEYILLCELESGDSYAINELANQLMLNLSTASRQIQALESKKYVTRFSDQNNGRISLIRITESGREILQKVKKGRYDVYENLLRDWSPQDLENLEKLLTRLNQDFKRLEL